MPFEGGLGVRADTDPTAGHALADIVIGFTDQVQVNTRSQEGAKTLAGDAGQC